MSTPDPTNEQDVSPMDSLKKSAPALIVFTVAVLVRAVLQFTDVTHAQDLSWVTTFAAIAATWLGISANLSDVVGRLRQVQKNTNGKSDEERTAIAKEAAGHVISQLVTRDNTTGAPPIVQLQPVTEATQVNDPDAPVR